METCITDGIQVSVQPRFEQKAVHMGKDVFFFSYHISITNLSSAPVKLLHRKWSIFDGNGNYREVEGPGVIGKQPEINPGAMFSYTSGCDIISNFGYMEGTYVFMNQLNRTLLVVRIPRFKMEVPWALN
ncbi:MAG: Co2+/Mg2+ efflux protein ApaG [Bacteroidota bacterium]|jgi:ApaG protein